MNMNLILLNKVKGDAAIIYQYFYTLVLIKELGLDQNTTSINKTYIQVNKAINQIISDHTTFLKKENLEVNEENKKILNICWTPKLHKHSPKARFIITKPKCSIKPLSRWE